MTLRELGWRVSHFFEGISVSWNGSWNDLLDSKMELWPGNLLMALEFASIYAAVCLVFCLVLIAVNRLYHRLEHFCREWIARASRRRRILAAGGVMLLVTFVVIIAQLRDEVTVGTFFGLFLMFCAVAVVLGIRDAMPACRKWIARRQRAQAEG